MFNGVLGFVMALAIIMVSTKLCGMFLRRLGLPQVLGYIIAGILIGPAITGNLGFALIGYESTPNIAEFVTLDEFLLDGTHDFTVLDVFSKIGVIMIMFSAGLETDLVELRRTGVAATLVAVSGVAIPLALGPSSACRSSSTASSTASRTSCRACSWVRSSPPPAWP